MCDPFVTSPALLGEYDCRSKNGTANVGEGEGSRGLWGGGGLGGCQITQTDCKPEVKKKGVVTFGLTGSCERLRKPYGYRSIGRRHNLSKINMQCCGSGMFKIPGCLRFRIPDPHPHQRI